MLNTKLTGAEQRQNNVKELQDSFTEINSLIVD